MKDIYSEIVRVLGSGTPAALATIIQVIGSSPRGVGAKFLVPKDSPTIGSIGGGCLEAEVWQGAMDSINHARSSLMRFRLDNENMADSGLICGGTISIFIEPLQSAEESQLHIYQKIKEMREQGKTGILASVLSRGGTPLSTQDSKILFGRGEKWGFLLEGEALEGQIRHWCAENPLKGPRLQSFQRTGGQSIEILLEPIEPDPTVYIFGAGHIAQALSPLGKMADFKVVIIDDRPMFADPKRFPEADEVLVEPFEGVFNKLQVNPQSYVVIVTRGHLHDGEVLQQAILTKAGYIGMIGSKRKVALLYQGLIDEGIKKELLDRAYAPIGIDIHSETPAEIAISIIGELIKVKAENAKRELYI
ncbi:MAG: XdhC family protein [Deltaproteobacteria bacterium]|nr:MAG: XdhC family protein [Deltaproteobacteria bacterium]